MGNPFIVIAVCHSQHYCRVAHDHVQHVEPCVLFVFTISKRERRFSVAYGVGKAGVDRLVKDMAVGETFFEGPKQDLSHSSSKTPFEPCRFTLFQISLTRL